MTTATGQPAMKFVFLIHRFVLADVSCIPCILGPITINAAGFNTFFVHAVQRTKQTWTNQKYEIVHDSRVEEMCEMRMETQNALTQYTMMHRRRSTAESTRHTQSIENKYELLWCILNAVCTVRQDIYLHSHHTCTVPTNPNYAQRALWWSMSAYKLME